MSADFFMQVIRLASYLRNIILFKTLWYKYLYSIFGYVFLKAAVCKGIIPKVNFDYRFFQLHVSAECSI
jgi:hypothetical protein